MKKIIFLIALTTILNAQSIHDKFKFSGILSYDVRKMIDMPITKNTIILPDEVPQKRSVLLAGTFSAILPGAGQFYNKEYIKAAIFLGVEAATIIVSVIYNKKGDNQTAFFQGFADQHWSVLRYAKWTIANASKINSSVDPSQFHVIDQNGNVNWSELNNLETAIGMGTNYYSHKLPAYGDQQYYELIGKYPQFVSGWDDFGNENTAFTYGDPLTNNFIYYSGERGLANDFYNVASKAVIVLIANHVISIFEAMLSTASYNKRIEANVTLEKQQFGFYASYSPVLHIKFNF